MALDFSNEPFFDDYSEDNKFYRILFRPGYAVQARELTQLQTILQEQVKRHGDHIFKDGSMVIPGQISYDLDVNYIKLDSVVSVNRDSDMASLVGKVITNGSLYARVVTYTSQTDANDHNTLYVKYINSNVVGNANISQFGIGDTLSFLSTQNDIQTGSSTVTFTVADTGFPVGKSSIAFVERGVFYIKKHFVLVEAQTIVLDRYTASPSYRVGLKLEESIVYPEEDESLLDNALGSPNYTAPGAARYKMELFLQKRSLTTADEEDFIDLMRLENGKLIYRIDRTQYAELEKTFARRTYDESGDYTVAPFGMQVRDYRSNFRGTWSGSKPFISGDVIRLSTGIVGGVETFRYFTAVKDGISGSTIPSGLSTLTPGQTLNDNTTTWRYDLIPIFNRGVYTFNASDATFPEVNDHKRLDGMFVVGVEPSKAYVKGYEVEKIATEYVTFEKSRDLPAGSVSLNNYLYGVNSALPAKESAISAQKTTVIDVSMGSYIIADSLLFSPDIVALTKVNLHSVVRATAATAPAVIGTARVRAIEKHSGTQFKVFLFDITMNSGKAFSDVRSIYTTGSSFQCNAVQVSSKTVLYEPDKTSLIYTLPDYAIKNIVDCEYTIVRRFTITTSGSSTASIIAPTASNRTYTFESVSNPSNYITIRTGTGDYVTPVYTLTTGSTQLNLSGGALVANTTYDVIATLKVSATANQEFATKVALVSVNTLDVTVQADVLAGRHVIAHPYVTRISSIRMSSNFSSSDFTGPTSADITNRYTFSSGNTASALLNPVVTLNLGEPLPTGNIRITYERLNFTSSADFLCVNSYTHADSSYRYDQIQNVGDVSLRDSIDFRPRVSAGISGDFDEDYFPKYATTMTIDYRHYLSRVDNLSLSSSGQYVVSSGIPAVSPVEPSIPNDAMKLGRVVVGPYTFDTTQSNVIVDRVENKRYTMRDIGKLERRIEDLEYYTTLNMLENDTKSLVIADSSGLDRFKNGFIVDNFTGQGVGNTLSPEWNASVDAEKRELRPFFSQKQVELLELSSQASTGGYKLSGDLVTLPYTEVMMLDQNKASKTESVNPYALFTFTGIVGLNPWSDTWFSTERRPDVIINDEGQYNAVISKAEADGVLGTVWNSWQTVFSSSRSLGSRLEKLAAWSTATNEIFNDTNQAQNNTTNFFWRNRGTFTVEELAAIGVTDGNLSGAAAQQAAGTRVLTIETSAVETTAQRAGVRSFVVDRVDSRVLEDRVVETKVVPFIRSRAILFTGMGFKPSTRMHAFFDGVNVNDYVTPAIKLKVNPVTNYSNTFDVTRNAGDRVKDQERNVRNISDLNPVDTIEIAFNHGEVIKEYISGVATGKSAIVVAQEQVGPDYFIYVMNLRNGVATPTAFTVGSTLVGEYGITPPRVQLVTSSSDLGTQGAPLIATATGMISGIFRIPNNPMNQFRTGTRELKFTDSISNVRTSETTRGSAFYEANGLIEVMQRTILSTRTAQLVQEQLSETNTIVNVQDRLTRDTGWFDPLAQTFLVQQDGGAFITSVDVFFSSVNQRIPVRVELREVVNGYPSSRVLPFSRVEKRGSEITTSTDATAATTFTFTSPVYVQNGVEYALVVLSDSNDYRVWISETSGVDVTTGVEINSQPYNGVLFKSQNGSAWTADQTQDMKFRIKRASFSTAPATLKFTTPTVPYKSLGFNPLKFIRGSNKVRVTHRNHGMKSGDLVRLVNRQVIDPTSYPFSTATTWVANKTYNFGDEFINAGTYYRVTADPSYQSSTPSFGATDTNNTIVIGPDTAAERAASIFNTNLTVGEVGLDWYMITIPNYTFNNQTVTAASSMSGGGAYISATENYEFQTAMIEVGEMTPTGTNTAYSILFGSDSYDMIPKENYNFETNRYIPSSIQTTYPTTEVVVKLNTTNTAISPVVDLGRAALTMISNRVDSPTVANSVVVGFDNEALATNFTITSAGPDINLKDLNTDSVLETLSIPTTSTTYYNSFNRLKVGSILRFAYSGYTMDMVITSKYTENNAVNFTLDKFVTTTDSLALASCTVSLLNNIVDEVSFGDGTVTSKYVTKKINLSRPSQFIRLIYSAIIPNEAEVEVYYKTGLNANGDFDAYGYKKAAPSAGYEKSNDTFAEVTYNIDNLTQFDTMMVKLVMKSTNKGKVPRIKDLRVIACA